MTRKPVANISASVRQRLLNRAHASGRPFSELMQYFALERFLYRLAKSPQADKFVLKGAMMLRARNAPDTRPTMDIDLLGKTVNEPEQLLASIRQTILTRVEDDGLTFDPDTLKAQTITKDARYDGARIRFQGELASARIAMQVDIGFGDVVFPAPERLTMPAMLEFPAPEILCYSLESAIAEKFEAAIKLGYLSTRIKDLYDIWLLASRFEFDGKELTESIRRTLENRNTALAIPIEIFESRFRESKSAAWVAFRKRLIDSGAPDNLSDALDSVERFLSPIVDALTGGNLPPRRWKPPGPWR